MQKKFLDAGVQNKTLQKILDGVDEHLNCELIFPAVNTKLVLQNKFLSSKLFSKKIANQTPQISKCPQIRRDYQTEHPVQYPL
jgi:hypothetical protein